MTEADWAGLKHFKITENWGEPEKMNRGLIYELDAFRDFISTSLFVVCGTNKHHLADSMHPSGNAVDVMFPEKSLKELFGIFLSATRFKFMGIGLYPGWHYDGNVIGGLHLDCRSEAHRALWMGVNEPEPISGIIKQTYVSMDPNNLKKYGLV